MAPPLQRGPDLMQSLFDWMREARHTLHPLVLSSVFHYKFVFLYPFSEGSERMERLWQTALPSEWNPIFQYLPQESRSHGFQDRYYVAISACHAAENSDVFVEFLLDRINLTLGWVMEQSSDKDARVSEAAHKLIDIMEYDVP